MVEGLTVDLRGGAGTGFALFGGYDHVGNAEVRFLKSGADIVCLAGRSNEGRIESVHTEELYLNRNVAGGHIAYRVGTIGKSRCMQALRLDYDSRKINWFSVTCIKHRSDYGCGFGLGAECKETCKQSEDYAGGRQYLSNVHISIVLTNNEGDIIDTFAKLKILAGKSKDYRQKYRYSVKLGYKRF